MWNATPVDGASPARSALTQPITRALRGVQIAPTSLESIRETPLWTALSRPRSARPHGRRADRPISRFPFDSWLEAHSVDRGD